MRNVLSAGAAAGALTACALLGGVSPAGAQDFEPRAYSNAPVGMNFIILGYAFTDGGLAFDPSAPLTDPELQSSNALLAYARVLDLWGKSAKFDAIVPFTWLSGSADHFGEPVERSVSGFADPRLRLSVNFHGAPALRMKQFSDYTQDLILGASLQVTVPVGQYDDGRLVNIGMHRWTFKPELGVSKAVGPWTFEFMAAATLFTDNEDFFGGTTRSQDPLASFQWHVIHAFKGGIWAAFDATYFTGGRTTIDDAESNDLQSNWRLGGTVAMPLNARNSIKLHLSSGVSARTGNNFDMLGIFWQRRWGGGL